VGNQHPAAKGGRSLDRPATREELIDADDNRQHQEQVNECTSDMKDYKTEEPQNQENQGNRPQHKYPPNG